MREPIKCRCGKSLPDIAVQAACEIGNDLKCFFCGTIHTHAALKAIKARPLSRHSDPQTSRQAAIDIQSKLRERQTRALKFVRENPGKTANELSNIAQDRDPRTIGRRLTELARMGLVTRGDARTCSTTGKAAATWFPVKVVETVSP